MPLKVGYRAVFISDVHLGAASSHADQAASFLKHVECQTLYLVGDIIDMWRLRSRWHWPESHNRFVRRVLKMAKQGTRVVLIPGNHDERARDYIGLNFGGVELARQAVHVTADGRRLLVTHGDEADLIVRHHRVLSVIGGAAYDRLVSANRAFNQVRVRCGLRPWSLSQYVKLRVKSACTFISRFEECLERTALDAGYDGVVCGHVHKAEIRAGVTAYYNCGDWVESCTALVEHDDGAMRIVDGLAFLDQFRSREADHPLQENSPLAASPIPKAPGRPGHALAGDRAQTLHWDALDS